MANNDDSDNFTEESGDSNNFSPAGSEQDQPWTPPPAAVWVMAEVAAKMAAGKFVSDPPYSPLDSLTEWMFQHPTVLSAMGEATGEVTSAGAVFKSNVSGILTRFLAVRATFDLLVFPSWGSPEEDREGTYDVYEWTVAAASWKKMRNSVFGDEALYAWYEMAKQAA